jgi:KamA family protein
MKYINYNISNFKTIEQIKALGEEEIFEIELVARVFPFKTNNYVIEKLIDWKNFKTDPCFILNFPQRGMLKEEDHERLSHAIKNNADKKEIDNIVYEIRLGLNPDSSSQIFNIPEFADEKIEGSQHKYKETMLFFPTQGQTCHAYCTFCFRWPQFSGLKEIKFATKEINQIIEYIKVHTEITDLLITGGDPMTMKSEFLEAYIDAVLDAEIPHLKTIRIGSKTLTYWPYRYLSDPDSEHILAIFKKIVDRGVNLSFMAHFNHINEMNTSECKQAVDKILATGAVIRTQSPILKNINDNPEIWRQMWRKQVNWGLIPYYMFIARDTGASNYFAISLEKAWQIFREAYSSVSGLARTVRGPSMSTKYGKIAINGLVEYKGEKIFVLSFIQSKKSEQVDIPFFAKYNAKAIWIDDLEPASSDKFPFEE